MFHKTERQVSRREMRAAKRTEKFVTNL